MTEIFIILAILFILNTPIVKGLIGELFVAIFLKMLNNEIYSVYHDLYITKENGTTSQIDHVVTSPFGIFVVETKNYAGWIFGNETSPKWTQVIYKKKSKFFNPIIQNKGHIKHLSFYLDNQYDLSSFISIISFSTRGTLKKVDTVTPVVHSIMLVNKIKKYKSVILSPESLMEINKKMSMLKRADFTTRRQHVRDIKSGKSMRSEKSMN